MTLVATAKRLLPTNRFARSVSILAGGTAAGQALLVLAAPILTRLYTPEDFGLLAVFAALLAIIAVIASLRYEAAIPLPDDDVEAAHIVVSSLIIVATIALSSFVVVALLGSSIAAKLNVPGLAGYLWLLPLGVLFAGSYKVFNYWAIRSKAFTAIARTKLTQAVSTIALQIGGFMLGPLALVLGQIAGQAAGTSSLGALALRKRWSVFRQVRVSGIKTVLVRYRRFPLFSTADGLLNTASTHVPMLLFAGLFSPAAAGVYALAQRVLAVPMSLIGRSVAHVFYAEGAASLREGRLGAAVSTIYCQLTRIAIVPALLVILIGPELFAMVFGAEWRVSGELARWMAPWLFFQFVSSPLSIVYFVLERQDHNLAFQTLLFSSRTIALVAGAWIGSFETAVILFALTSAACYVGMLIWINALVGNDAILLLRPGATSLALGLVVVSPLAAAAWLSFDISGWLAASGASAILSGVVGWRVIMKGGNARMAQGVAS